MKNRGFVLCVLVLAVKSLGFSQDRNIGFPDVASDGSIRAERDSVPGFSRKDAGGRRELPKLEDELEEPVADFELDMDAVEHAFDDVPSVSEEEVSSEDVSFDDAFVEEDAVSAENEKEKNSFESAKKKSVDIEALVGGGYPDFFVGDVKIKTTDESSPFTLSYGYRGLNGYGRKSAGDGYFDHVANIYLDKVISGNDAGFEFSASYERNDYGLSGKSPAFYDLNMQDAGVAVVLLGGRKDAGFSVNLKGNAFYHNRYMGVKDSSLADFSQEENSHVLYFAPNLDFHWQYDEFYADLYGDMGYQFFAGNHDDVSFGEKKVFRAGGYFALGYKDDAFLLEGMGGVADGTSIGDNYYVPVWHAAFNGRWKVNGCTDDFEIKVKGGISSFMSAVSELEKEFRYSSLLFVPSETSDWFLDSSLMLPVSGGFSVKGESFFRKTFWGNGEYEADYSSVTKTNVLGFVQNERTCLKTSTGPVFRAGSFLLEGMWTCNWKHVKSNEYKNKIGGTVSYETSSRRFSFSAGIEQILDGGEDRVPYLNESILYRLNGVASLKLVVEDTIKLFGLKGREYHDTDYLVPSGSATLLAQFVF